MLHRCTLVKFGLAMLALGIATSVCVAWALSYSAEGTRGGSNLPRSTVYTIGWTTDAGTAGVATTVEYHWRGVSYLRFFRRWTDDYYARDAQSCAKVAPAWAATRLDALARTLPEPEKRDMLGSSTTSDLLIGAGWPWPAVSCHAKAMFTVDMAAFPGNADWGGPGVEKVYAGAMTVPRGMRKGSEEHSALLQPHGLLVPLPYRPLWFGLLADSALFGLVWAVLFGAVIGGTRYRRQRRLASMRCVHCRYDLAGLPPESRCPECGRVR